jgi:hypothetical protein
VNFDDAINAHTAWKMKLSLYLRKADGSLKPNQIEPDNQCPLGQWIYGEGAKHAHMPEFVTLKSEHAKFHKAAADVVRKADAGQSVAEEMAIGSKTAFGTSSSAVIQAIMAMKRKAG